MMAGLITPIACAAHVGLMSVAAWTHHRGKGFFVFTGGWEYVGLVALMAACLAALGPGRWSVDRALGWHLIGLALAGLAMALGFGAAARPLVVGGEHSRADVTK
jgi:putative oxidoreductase